MRCRAERTTVEAMDRRTFIKAAAAAVTLPLIPGSSEERLESLNEADLPVFWPGDCPVDIFAGYLKGEEEEVEVWARHRFSDLMKGDLFKLYTENGEQKDVGRDDEIACCDADAHIKRGRWGVQCTATEGKTYLVNGDQVIVVRVEGRLKVVNSLRFAERPWKHDIGWFIVNPRAIARGMA